MGTGTRGKKKRLEPLGWKRFRERERMGLSSQVSRGEGGGGVGREGRRIRQIGPKICRSQRTVRLLYPYGIKKKKEVAAVSLALMGVLIT